MSLKQYPGNILAVVNKYSDNISLILRQHKRISWQYLDNKEAILSNDKILFWKSAKILEKIK